MSITQQLSAPHRRRRVVARLALPLAALSLALSACASSGPTAEPTAEPTHQEFSVPSSTPESSSSPSTTGTSGPTAPVPPSSTPDTPPAVSAVNATLTITIQQDAAAEPVQYVLECVDGVPGPASTLPGADAACARLAELGMEFFTARPNKDVICTQQYGGPQTASISGDLNGTSVRAAFALTDGCEISRWNSVRDLLGTPGAQ